MHTIDSHNMIAKLKMQPRHGRATEKERQDEATNFIQKLTALIPSATAVLEQYDTVLSTINTDATQLSMGLGKVIGIQETFATQINLLIKNITFLEEKNKKLNESYGISSVTAQKYAKQLRTLAISTEVGSDKFIQYAVDLKNMTNGFLFASKEMTKFGKNLLLTQQFLQNNLKVSAAAAEGYEYYASTVADSGAEAATIHEQLSQVLAGKTGLDALEIQKTLTEDIGTLTADMQMQYSRIPGSLELAVLKSKALGASLENLNSAGENLLNIEQSIGSELEYQLLSGKRLLTQDGKSLTNAYRMATIQGDANKQAELMDQFLKDQGPILEKNMFARKKAAELMGVDEATMARMLQKQKIMSELGVENLMKLNQNDIGTVVAKLRKDGIDESKIQELIKSTDTRTTAEKQEQWQNSMLDATIAMAENAGLDVGTTSKDAMAGARSFSGIMTQFSKPEMAQAFGAVATTGETLVAITSPLNSLVDKLPLIGKAISSFVDNMLALYPSFSTGTGVTSTVSSVNNDALIMNDGIIKFHQDDKFMRVNDSTMIAGTNVDGNRQLARAINGGGGSNIDYGKMAMAIAAAMRNVNLTVKVDRDIYAPSTLNPGGRRT